MLENFLSNLIYGYEVGEDNPEINDHLVVAGDPVCDAGRTFKPICLPKEEAAWVLNLKEYKVRGFSMYPCGISDSDHIYVSRGINNADLKANDFIMIKVNQDDYEHEKVHFKHKLRRFLMNLKAEESFENIVAKLKEIQPEILLDSYQKRLREKYEKSQNRYKNAGKFSLSFTFKEGVMTYSFHPSKDIEGRIEYVYSKENERLKKSSDFKPYC